MNTPDLSCVWLDDTDGLIWNLALIGQVMTLT